MPILKLISEQEKNNLKKMQRLENEALAFTANRLVREIKNAIISGDDFPNKFMTTYVTTYTNSMMVSWLVGQIHILKRIDETIELSNAPILLAVEPVPFQEAIDAMSAMVPTDSETYRQIEASMKLRAFTIANISSLDAVDRVKKIYIKAIEEGQSRSEALNNLDKYLETQGISEANPYWLELHYRNNMMTAYNSGRWTQIADNELVEFLTYVSVMDDGTTELCTELDGVTKQKSDEFWVTFYPPNHHKCRGTVSVLTRKQFDKLPDNIKRKSADLTKETLYKNDTYKKEHQFTGSPVVAMKALPESMAKNMVGYGLTKDVLNYSYDQSKKLIQEQVAKTAKVKVTKRVLDAAVKRQPELEPFREMITSQLPSPADDVVFGFNVLTRGEWLPSILRILELDDKHRAVAFCSAFDSASIYDIRHFTKDELEALISDYVTM
ncbi:phage minor head protein [Vibrio mimicus]